MNKFLYLYWCDFHFFFFPICHQRVPSDPLEVLNPSQVKSFPLKARVALKILERTEKNVENCILIYEIIALSLIVHCLKKLTLEMKTELTGNW